MEIINKLKNFYSGKRVFITGHTGFKGSWLSLWLNIFGAKVKGYALDLDSSKTQTHWGLLNLDIESVISDIRNKENLKKEIKSFNPDIIFHLAAQSLVGASYCNPVQTYETNVIGTLNVFEASRNIDSIRAIINVTSDKCYENNENATMFYECDPMGGYDPYSSSKGCSEILTSSYRESYWSLDDYGKKHNILLATARAGNVVGGGDWAENRLIPDIVKAIANNDKVCIRNPNAIRPWQHVLEPLFGYLLLGEKLYEGNKGFSGGWNFGPKDESDITVIDIINEIKSNWKNFDIKIEDNQNFHEAKTLMLNSDKAFNQLNWRTQLNTKETVEYTIEWYNLFYSNNKIISLKQIENYMNLIKKRDKKN